MTHRLNVIAVEPTHPKRDRAQRFEELWQRNPKQFDPERNVMEKERIDRTGDLIQRDLHDKRVADLGCGTGALARRLANAGARVDAVDIAKKPLEALEGIDNIQTSQSSLPKTLLEDDAYDLVLCTDVIAHLHPHLFRLLMSEMARLVKPDGYVVCSTPLEVQSEGAFERFAALAETEFDTEAWILSHHLFHLRLRNFFEAPNRFVRASGEEKYREEALSKRRSLGRLWFKLNSTKPLALIWRAIAFCLTPVTTLLRWNRPLLQQLERFCRFACSEGGATHAIFIGKRRPLIPQPDILPQETKHKKQLWE